MPSIKCGLEPKPTANLTEPHYQESGHKFIATWIQLVPSEDKVEPSFELCDPSKIEIKREMRPYPNVEPNCYLTLT